MILFSQSTLPAVKRRQFKSNSCLKRICSSFLRSFLVQEYSRLTTWANNFANISLAILSCLVFASRVRLILK